MDFGKLDPRAASVWSAGEPAQFEAFVYTTKLLEAEELLALQALGLEMREASVDLLMYRTTILLSGLEEMVALPYIKYVQASHQLRTLR